MANRKIPGKVNLADFEQLAIESLGQQAGVTIELPTGEEITIPHPMLVTDAQQAELERISKGEDLDDDGKINGERPEPEQVRTARTILGPEVHKRFIEAGGKSNHIMLAWGMMTRELQEKGPKLPR